MSRTVPPVILPGFANPVHDAQTCFRTLLEAMSQPGKTVSLSVMPPVTYLNATMPAACLAGMVCIALTLCDTETPVWLDACLDTPAMRQHLRFHCGCPIVPDPGQASLAFIGNARGMPRFDRFSSGDPEYPDRSATLIIAADLTAADPDRRLSGPGVSNAHNPQGLLFGSASLPAWFWDDRAENEAGYPQGVDVFFVESRQTVSDSVRIAGLPRTTFAAPAHQAGSGPFKERISCTLQ